MLVGILHWTFNALFGFDLSFSTLELSKSRWTWNVYLNCFCEMDSLQFLIIPSYLNYQYLFCGSYQKSAFSRYFNPFTIGFPVKNKQQSHSKHLAFYLVYGTEGIIRA